MKTIKQTKKLNVFIPENYIKTLKKEAESENKSLTWWLSHLIIKHCGGSNQVKSRRTKKKL